MLPTQTLLKIFQPLAMGFKFKTLTACVVGYVIYLLGYDYLVVEVLSYLIVMDLVLGLMKAVKNQNFQSRKMGRFANKLLLYFILLIMAHQAIRLEMIPGWFDEVVELFLGITEIKSILENTAELGFPGALQIEKKLNKYVAGKFDIEI